LRSISQRSAGSVVWTDTLIGLMCRSMMRCRRFFYSSSGIGPAMLAAGVPSRGLK
jgi:hypothetical protein